MLSILFVLLTVAIGDHDHATRLPQSTLPPVKETYEEARARAVHEQKPFVVWSGSAVCPPCVQTLSGEAVSWVGRVQSLPADAIIVAMPDGNGDLMRVATITQWITNDATYGHVPSVRRAVRTWKASRHTTASGWSLEPAPPPMMVPMRISMRSFGGGVRC